MKRAYGGQNRGGDEQSVWRVTWHLLGSVRFALMIVLLLAVASILRCPR